MKYKVPFDDVKLWVYFLSKQFDLEVDWSFDMDRSTYYIRCTSSETVWYSNFVNWPKILNTFTLRFRFGFFYNGI